MTVRLVLEIVVQEMFVHSDTHAGWKCSVVNTALTVRCCKGA